MERENHYGEPFKFVCPHCGSDEIQNMPSVNLLQKWLCHSCMWMWGVRNYDSQTQQIISPVILGCIYITPEERRIGFENMIKGCIKEVQDKLKRCHDENNY